MFVGGAARNPHLDQALVVTNESVDVDTVGADPEVRHGRALHRHQVWSREPPADRIPLVPPASDVAHFGETLERFICRCGADFEGVKTVRHAHAAIIDAERLWKIF